MSKDRNPVALAYGLELAVLDVKRFAGGAFDGFLSELRKLESSAITALLGADQNTIHKLQGIAYAYRVLINRIENAESTMEAARASNLPRKES
jgi:hypothetical protein